MPDTQWDAFVSGALPGTEWGLKEGGGAQIASSLPSRGCTFFPLSLHSPYTPIPSPAQFFFFLSFPSLSSPRSLVLSSGAFCLFLWFSLHLALSSLPELHTP